MMFHGHVMRSLLVFRCLHWPSLWGLRLPHGFCILAVGRWAAPAAWHIFVKIFTWKSRRKSHEIPASSDTPATFPICFNLMFFPNSVRLGSSAIVKVPEQAGAAKSARRKVGNRVPRKGFLFQENPSEQPNPHRARLETGFAGTGSQAKAPSKRFPSKVPRKRFPSKVPKNFPGTGSQVPKQGSQARFPGRGSQQHSQASFPGNKQGFPARVSQAGFPGRGYQEEGFEEEAPRQGSQEVPSKAPRNMFPSKCSPAKGFPARGSQARVPRKRFPSKGSQEEVPKQGSQKEVPKQGFPGRGFQEQVPKQGSEGQVCKQTSQEQVPKQGFE